MSRSNLRDTIFILCFFAVITTCLFLPYYEEYVSVAEDGLYKAVYKGFSSGFQQFNLTWSIVVLIVVLLGEDKFIQKVFFIPAIVTFLLFSAFIMLLCASLYLKEVDSMERTRLC
jgi:hypothetical protein